MLREFIYDCRVPSPVTGDQGRPDAVTMLVGGRINASVVVDPRKTACVPIEFPDRPSVQADFAVCVQAWILYRPSRLGARTLR